MKPLTAACVCDRCVQIGSQQKPRVHTQKMSACELLLDLKVVLSMPEINDYKSGPLIPKNLYTRVKKPVSKPKLHQNLSVPYLASASG